MDDSVPCENIGTRKYLENIDVFCKNSIFFTRRLWLTLGQLFSTTEGLALGNKDNFIYLTQLFQ